MEGGPWVCMERMEKGESEKGCVPQRCSFTKNTTWATLNIPFFLFCVFLRKPYIKRSLYSLYVREEAPPPPPPRRAERPRTDYDLPAYACMEHL